MRRKFQSAVVFGGAGFVGSHLCDALVENGIRTACIDNLATGPRSNIDLLETRTDFMFVEHDVTVPLDDWSDDVDVVFHLASAASPADYLKMPLETLHAGSTGTENALLFAATHRARFVLASTSEVYGDPQVHPQHESYFGNVNPIGPRSVYDEAKRYAEALTFAYRRTHGVDTTIARIFNTYGPRMRVDDGRMIPTFIGQALDQRPMTVTGTGRQTRSICYVTDLVSGLLALAQSSHCGPVNLGNPWEQTVLEIAARIARIVGSTEQIDFIPVVVDDPQRRRPDISLARTLLGWSPAVEPSVGLTRTVEWFRTG